MKALVLSGGSIKGAFQAGAITQVLRSGFVPDLVVGISVGALNGAFLADRSGRMAIEGGAVDWPEIAGLLERFWDERVRRPSDLVTQHSLHRVGESIADGRFTGFTSTSPLRRMVREEVEPERLLRSPLRLKAGAVNMRTGQLAYVDTADPTYRQQGLPNVHEWILASTAIPIAMPPVALPRPDRPGSDDLHYDGGIREIAPVGTAINAGATEIICISCEPRRRQRINEDLNFGNLITLFGRLQDLVTGEILERDLQVVDLLNRTLRVIETVEALQTATGTDLGAVVTQLRQLAGLGDKTRIPRPILIAPPYYLRVDITSFRQSDIRGMFALGRQEAATEIGNRRWS